MDESRITINGSTLTVGQSMVVRVACTAFWLQMSHPDALGDDSQGKKMTEGYKARLREVVLLLDAQQKEPS